MKPNCFFSEDKQFVVGNSPFNGHISQRQERVKEEAVDEKLLQQINARVGSNFITTQNDKNDSQSWFWRRHVSKWDIFGSLEFFQNIIDEWFHVTHNYIHRFLI